MHSKHIAAKALKYFLLVLFLLWTIVPIYLVVTNSFKHTLDIKTVPPKILFEPTLSHYAKIFADGNFGKYFVNSMIVAGATTFISVIGGALGAYGLLLIGGKWAKRASTFMLIGKLVPAIAILIPFYTLLDAVNLNGRYFGPVMAHSAVNIPFVVWLMSSFMSDIPCELRESANIDGATRMQTFWRILFPMLTPAIGSAVMLVMRFSWNELIFSIQLTNMDSYTLPVGIGRYVGSVSVDWGKSSAAAAVAMIPMIIIGFMMQKYLVSGLTAGAVKE
jgi:ABC-type glycerol-3-phosphate transport system permease component